MVKEDNERAVVTVLGGDKVGIVAKVTEVLAANNANIVDISQTLLEDLFSMIMLIEIDELEEDFETLKKDLEETGDELEVKIMLQHEEIFRYMHRI